jgi:hypothetical protein
MRQGEVDLSPVLKRGLRRFGVSPRGSLWLLECHNWAPAEEGIEPHETVTSLGATSIAWGGEGAYSPTVIVRDITIRVTDYVDDSELPTVTVYLDGVSQGTTDSNGEITISTVTVGGHELKLTKTGYQDSDADTLFNDYIMVI